MERRSFLQQTGLGLLGLTFMRFDALGALVQDPAYKLSLLRNNIGVFTEMGGTIVWFLSKDGTVVVDAQFPTSAAHLIAELKKKTEKPFDLLINTHHHFDHTSGNIAFKGLVKHVVAHENSLAAQKLADIQGKKDITAQLYPDTTFKSNWKYQTGGEHIKAHYFGAGHTNGDIMVHFENANIVHLGDLVFNRRFPYIDKPSGASIKNWITVLEHTHKLFDKDTIFVCGHAQEGYTTTLNGNDVKAFQNYLDRLLDLVSAQIKLGKSKEEIMAIKTIPGAEEWKGDGIERSLSAAYQELTT